MKGRQRGFTLLELLVAVLILGIVLGGIYVVYATNHTTFVRGLAKIAVQQDARLALDVMAKNIRMAGYDPSNVLPSCTPTTAIQAASANSITFVGDVTGDVANLKSDRDTYRLQGSQVIRDFSTWSGSACGWSPNPPSSRLLAENISSLAFQYFDAGNNLIPSPVATGSLGSIRRITISVTTQKTAAGKQQSFPLTVDVRLRNLQ